MIWLSAIKKEVLVMQMGFCWKIIRKTDFKTGKFEKQYHRLHKQKIQIYFKILNKRFFDT